MKHHVIDPRPWGDERAQVWREHTLETYKDADDTYLIPQDQYRFLKAGDLLIRGGCFEFGRRFYETRLKGLTFENATAAHLWARFETGPSDAGTIAYLEDWLAWRREHDNGLDLVDAFYLDQRAGSWLSAVEHGLDVHPGMSVPAADCGQILSSLITPGEADRRTGRLQREVIHMLEPNLLRFPINPIKLSDRLRHSEYKLKQAVKRLLPVWLVRRLKR